MTRLAVIHQLSQRSGVGVGTPAPVDEHAAGAPSDGAGSSSSSATAPSDAGRVVPQLACQKVAGELATRREQWSAAMTLDAIARYAEDLDAALMWGTNYSAFPAQQRADRIAFRRKTQRAREVLDLDVARLAPTDPPASPRTTVRNPRATDIAHGPP